MLNIYTDGACKANGSKNAIATWAFIALDENCEREFEAKGVVDGLQTNNTGELTAILKALQYAISREHECCAVFSDSLYAINSIKVWDIEGLVKGKPKKNYDLIKSIQELTEAIDVSFHWVRGHDGDYWNTQVDALANSEAGI